MFVLQCAHLPVFIWNLMAGSVGVGQQGCTAGIRTATRAAVCSPTVLCMSSEVPFCAVAVATLYTLMFLLCVHLHEMLVCTHEEIKAQCYGIG